MAPIVHRTPCKQSYTLNCLTGSEVSLKLENLQKTGSFKVRGAFNKISQLSDAECERGIVCASAGNHAQGVAMAGKEKGVPVTVFMPEGTPEAKVLATRQYGATVRLVGKSFDEAYAAAKKEQLMTGTAFVHPFDDLAIIEGQATVAMEMLQQCPDLDTIVVPAGGGGLLAGSMLSAAALSPETNVYCVEPAGFDDHARSLGTGAREVNSGATGSICDALLSPQPGQLTFAINGPRLAGGLVVSDDEVRDAMRFAFTHLKLVVEPGGSVALAAILSGKIDTKEKSTGIILSGGNVDPGLFGETLTAAA